MGVTMETQIARAIERTMLACDAFSHATEPNDWSLGPSILAARAVLVAMREPTEAMVFEGDDVLGAMEAFDIEKVREHPSPKVWLAMIDAAMGKIDA